MAVAHWPTPSGPPPSILLDEERRLAVLRYVARTIPPADRWAPIMARYIEQVASRALGFGGNPDRIPGSGMGSPRDQARGCLSRWIWMAVRYLLAQAI